MGTGSKSVDDMPRQVYTRVPTPGEGTRVHTVGKSGTYVRPFFDPSSHTLGGGDTSAKKKCQHEFILRPLIPAPDLLSQPEYWSLPKNVDRMCP